MNTGMIPVRYAKALFEYAGQAQCTDRVYAEMKAVADSYINEPSLRRILDNPVLGKTQKSELMHTAAGGAVSEVFSRFVEVVLHNHRERYFRQMSLMYLDLYRHVNHISIGRLETAVEPATHVRERISQLIASREGGTVELTTAVKPELLGGFIFEMNSERLDASVATELRNIRKQFIEKNKRIV